jgi:hypothetical protein
VGLLQRPRIAASGTAMAMGPMAMGRPPSIKASATAARPADAPSVDARSVDARSVDAGVAAAAAVGKDRSSSTESWSDSSSSGAMVLPAAGTGGMPALTGAVTCTDGGQTFPMGMAV